MNEGKKYDAGKAMFRLVPPKALEETAKVLTFGAQKYGPDNWRLVENAEQRYIDAALRHINAYLQGVDEDPESGLHHLAHALCGILFVTELRLEKASFDEIPEQPNPHDAVHEAKKIAFPTKWASMRKY